MVTELFTILVKSFSIYSLGFVLANFRKTPIKKEINFGLEHSLVGLLALIFISWSSYLIFNNALLNIQYYFYIFLTIVLLIRFKNFILKQYLQLFVIVSILFFIVNFFELNTSTNDSIAYFYTEGLNFKNKQFSLLIDFRSIPLIIISGYFDITNINYVAIIPGLVNTLGLLSINSYLKKNNFFLQNDIFSKMFRFILLFTPVLIFHLFYLNVHFLFGILLTFILFQHYLSEEFDNMILTERAIKHIEDGFEQKTKVELLKQLTVYYKVETEQDINDLFDKLFCRIIFLTKDVSNMRQYIQQMHIQNQNF